MAQTKPANNMASMLANVTPQQATSVTAGGTPGVANAPPPAADPPADRSPQAGSPARQGTQQAGEGPAVRKLQRPAHAPIDPQQLSMWTSHIAREAQATKSKKEKYEMQQSKLDDLCISAVHQGVPGDVVRGVLAQFGITTD